MMMATMMVVRQSAMNRKTITVTSMMPSIRLCDRIGAVFYEIVAVIESHHLNIGRKDGAV